MQDMITYLKYGSNLNLSHYYVAGQTTYSTRKTFPLCSFKDILVYVLCNKVLNYLSVRLILAFGTCDWDFDWKEASQDVEG